MKKSIVISGTGCALADNLYTNINFSSRLFQKYLSKSNADGGLSPGKLVFTEEFERFAGKQLNEIIHEITRGKDASSFNIGGPAIVPLIGASQLLYEMDVDINFYGAIGNDNIGDLIMEGLKSTSVNYDHYKRFATPSPFTDVLSDPNYDEGRGERIFINNIGAAWKYQPDDLNDGFFNADITVFGGTALVPHIHDGLTELLQEAKSRGALTIVNTVYDFRNEKLNPDGKWPLVKNDNFILVDLLIMDKEESLKISGKSNINEAVDHFIKNGVGALMITQGPEPVIFWASGVHFSKTPISKLPVSRAVSSEITKGELKGDTTGCGDNFVGGVIASIAQQLLSGVSKPDMETSVMWGIVSGGLTCFYKGGVYHETEKGQKLKVQKMYLDAYQQQLNIS